MNKIFYPYPSYNYNGNEIICDGNLIIFNKDNATDFKSLLNDEKQYKIYLPLDFDTEFQIINKYYERLFSENNINTLTITGQLKPVNEDTKNTLILNDSLFIKLFPHLKRYPTFKDNIFQTFLNQIGVHGKIIRERKMNNKRYKKIAKKKKLIIPLYFHFGIADFFKGFKGEFLRDVLNDSKGKNPQLIKDKRFHTKNDFTYKPKWFFQHLETGETIPLEFQLIDQCAIYGDASRSLEKVFQALSLNVGDKQLLNQKQKENIINTYEYLKDDFHKYAINDCRIHECLYEVVKLQFKLYLDLKLQTEILPTLTLGATTKNTFIECLKAKFDDEVMNFVSTYSSKELCKNLSKILALNAICNGGRAFNNNALKFTSKGFILDWDVMSAYVINMLIQPYFVGKASYYDSSKERKTTLKSFLKRHGHNFNDRSFQIVINGKLTQNQDYFISNELPNKWYQLADYSNIKDEEKLMELKGQKVPNKEYSEQELKQLKVNQDKYRSRGDWVQDKSVSRKHFSKELYNVIVTYDGLMWIQNHTTQKLSEEILNCEVVTAMWYDKEKQVSNYSDLEDGNWLCVSVGELLINEVFINRKKYSKYNPSEYPMNNIFKYMGNSLNGDFMSNFFNISNPVVGNSICGRTRHCVWLGQAIGTQEIVTDGGFIDLLNVLYPSYEEKRITSDTVCYQNGLQQTTRFKQKPLGTIKHLEWLERGLAITFEDNSILRLEDDMYGSAKQYFKTNNFDKLKGFEYIKNGILLILEDGKKVELLDNKKIKARQYFDKLLHKELTKIFPYDHVLNEEIKLPHNSEIINGFVFESKGIIEKVISHGQANYYFDGGYHENFKNGKEIKMRSYCMKFRNVREVLNDFLIDIGDNPSNVKRSKPFLITQIITPKIYAIREKLFEDKNLIIGDTLYKVCWFKECSLSAFHFCTINQYKKFITKQQSLKNKYGQSFEMYFENINGTLNYQEMMEYLDNLISNNKSFVIPKKRKSKYHPYYEKYTILKDWCDNQYASKNQSIFLEDLIKQFDFEIIDCSNLELIKNDKDLKSTIELEDIMGDLLSA